MFEASNVAGYIFDIQSNNRKWWVTLFCRFCRGDGFLRTGESKLLVRGWSIPVNFFWDIGVTFSSWEFWEFWRRHDHFRSLPKTLTLRMLFCQICILWRKRKQPSHFPSPSLRMRINASSLPVLSTSKSEIARKLYCHLWLWVKSLRHFYPLCYPVERVWSLRNDDDDGGNKNVTNLHIWQWKTIVLHALYVQFSLLTFRRRSRSFCDVKWHVHVLQLYGRRDHMMTNVQFCLLISEAPVPI